MVRGARQAGNPEELPSATAYTARQVLRSAASRTRNQPIRSLVQIGLTPKSQTAQRVCQPISAVMKWAVAMGYRPDNAAGDAIGQALGRQPAVVQHMRALLHGAVADALATVRTSRALVTTNDAFELLVLTAARSGEVRLATWDEMDPDAGVWTIPAARMKAKRDHCLPLSGRAIEILHDARRRSDGTGLMFRGPRGKRLSDMTLSNLIKELGITAVPHGFRSSFRDWATERTEHTPRSGRGRTRPYGTRTHRGGLRPQGSL